MPPPEVEAHVGKALNIACKASGQPTPRVEWTKLHSNGSGATILGSRLELNSVNQQDSGLYECRAKNGIEKDLYARTKLTVLGKYSS